MLKLDEKISTVAQRRYHTTASGFWAQNIGMVWQRLNCARWLSYTTMIIGC